MAKLRNKQSRIDLIPIAFLRDYHQLCPWSNFRIHFLRNHEVVLAVRFHSDCNVDRTRPAPCQVREKCVSMKIGKQITLSMSQSEIE